jgi:hypothetical protein
MSVGASSGYTFPIVSDVGRVKQTIGLIVTHLQPITIGI